MGTDKKTERTAALILLIACAAVYAGVVAFFSLEAESKSALLFLVALMLPAVAVTAVSQIVALIRGAGGMADVVAIVIAAVGSFFISGFWVLICLVGGDANIPTARLVVSVNFITLAVFLIKMFVCRGEAWKQYRLTALALSLFVSCPIYGMIMMTIWDEAARAHADNPMHYTVNLAMMAMLFGTVTLFAGGVIAMVKAVKRYPKNKLVGGLKLFLIIAGCIVILTMIIGVGSTMANWSARTQRANSIVHDLSYVQQQDGAN